MDRLRIDGLTMTAIVGVRDWERLVRQIVVIDLELQIDTRSAAATDRLEDAVDYGAVSRTVTALVETSSARLIEHLAEEVAACVLQGFARVYAVRVALHKPGAVPNARDVVLVVERSRA
jgi:dihydroneopterin aldolase